MGYPFEKSPRIYTSLPAPFTRWTDITFKSGGRYYLFNLLRRGKSLACGGVGFRSSLKDFRAHSVHIVSNILMVAALLQLCSYRRQKKKKLKHIHIWQWLKLL